MREQHKSQIYSSGEMVARLCKPLFDRTPITFFIYAQLFDDGNRFVYASDPEVECKVLDFYATKLELDLFNKLGHRITQLSHQLEVPDELTICYPDKYENNIEYYTESGVYHRLYFLERFENYYRFAGFGVGTEQKSEFNFYFNNMPLLEQFIAHFETEMREYIEETKVNDLVYVPEYFEVPAMDIYPHLQSMGLKKFQVNEIVKSLMPEKLPKTLVSMFTPREHECVALIARGYTMKAVAQYLKISPRTVEVHLRNIKDKFSLKNKQEIVELWHASQCDGIYQLATTSD